MREERAKSKNIGAMSTIWPFVRPYRLLIAAASIALVLTAVLSLILPIAVRRVVDGFEAATITLLDEYFGVSFLIALGLAAGSGLRYYLVTRLGERVVADIRKALFTRMIGMSPAFFERIVTGEVLSRLTTDTTLILSVVGSTISFALRNLLILIGGLALLLITSPKLTGLVLLIVPAVVAPISVIGRRVRVLSRQNQEWIAQSSGSASEALLGVQAVQSYTHEATTLASFDDVTEKSFVSAKARIGIRALMTFIVILIAFSSIVGVLWVGARDVRSDAMSVGELVQFVIYSVMVASSVGALSEIWGELQRAAGAAERLTELLTAVDSVKDPAEPVRLPSAAKGGVAFEDVSFEYPARPGRGVLDRVSFAVEPGETVALVGPSGAGKSTVLQLILRFYDPESGRITLEGIDLRDMERSDFRRALSLVPQDPVIFADTARANIRFGRPGASDAEVEAAARAAAAHDFLATLPDGYESYVGERGVMLSGGQKQRIAIARAILRDAPVFLLDEATSALDAESEHAVQRALENLARNRTVIVVAHRLATVKKADRILVFEDGRIAAEGTHEELVGQGGLYARLARLQFTDGTVPEKSGGDLGGIASPVKESAR